MSTVFDILFFVFRYIPFWSIPLMLICIQFAIIFWIKEVFYVSYILYGITAVCGLFLIYYIYAGSPDNAARILDDMLRGV